MNISKGEIVSGVIAFAGAAVMAVSAPYLYFVNKYYSELEEKAKESSIFREYDVINGLHSKNEVLYIWCSKTESNLSAIINHNDEYMNSEEYKVLEGWYNFNCQNIDRQYTSSRNQLNLILDKMKKGHYSKIKEYQTCINQGAAGTGGGILFSGLGLFAFFASREKRKELEEKERKKTEKVKLKNCSSLDDHLYCTKTIEPHLDTSKDVARINSFLK